MTTCRWVEVEHAGVTWLVAPTYRAPVGIGEAADIARDLGCELPTPDLVDAIWRAADLRLEPITARHLGGLNLGNNVTQAIAHRVAVDKAIADRAYTLLAGTHKDVVRIGDKLGLYGWHRLDGRPWQGPYTRHELAWRDYSQGLRLVKRAT